MTMNIYIEFLKNISLIEVNDHYRNRLLKLLAHLKTLDIGDVKHHIIPQSWSLGDRREKENIVKVTAKQHFILHHLMWRSFPSDKQMKQSYFTMCHMQNGKRVTARVSEILDKEYRQMVRERFKGIPKSEESKRKNSESHTGKNLTDESKEKLRVKALERCQKDDYINPMDLPGVREKHLESVTTEEYRQESRDQMIRRYSDPKEREKVSKRVSGEGNPMHGIHPRKVICEVCGKEVTYPGYVNHHGENCGKKTKELSERMKGEGNPMFGRSGPRLGVKLELFHCNHCGKDIAGLTNFNRWHNDNCKENSLRNAE